MNRRDIEAKAREYPITVSWSDEDRLFIATAPDWGLPPGAQVGAKTEEKALRLAREAIEDSIGAFVKEGRPLPLVHARVR